MRLAAYAAVTVGKWRQRAFVLPADCATQAAPGQCIVHCLQPPIGEVGVGEFIALVALASRRLDRRGVAIAFAARSYCWRRVLHVLVA